MDKLSERLAELIKTKNQKAETVFTASVSKLEGLSPLKVLARGYASLTDSNGKTISSVKKLKKGDELNLRLSDGKIECQVTKIKN